MAKVCRNCGKKIGFGEKGFKLKETLEYLCQDCGSRVGPMLEDLKCPLDLDSFRRKKTELLDYMDSSHLTDATKRTLEREIEVISERSMSNLVLDPCDAITFESDFKTSYNMIVQCADGNLAGDPLIIEVGDTKSVAFVFEEYFMRNGSYASLTVNLVHRDGRAYITAAASGGGEGIFNISYGAEDDYVSNFWRNIFSKYPRIDFDRYPAKTAEQLNNRAIGVLGGTFDPVHNGHVALAKAALMQGNLKKLIVMPAHVQPFKLGKDISDDSHRLEMTKLAFADMPEVEVSDYEIRHTDISYTYETLCKLKEIYPDDEIAFIMGTDSFLNLDTWYMGRELLETFSFLVSVRPGYRESELEQKIEEFRRLYETKVEKLVMEMPDISSTEIRIKYESGLSVSGDVPEAVERYINEYGLYK